MEIQESVLRNVHLLIGWQASPRYADFRGALTEQLREIAGPDSEWTWDGPMTLVSGEERDIDLALSPTELIIASESPEQELGDIPANLASLVLEQLSIKEVRLIGAGSCWLAPASSLDDLNGWLSDQLGALGKPGLYDAFGGKPTSFSFEAEIEDESFSYDVELKSMTASEAAQSDDFRSDEEGDFPPIALYLEILRAEVGEISAATAPESFSGNLEKAIAAARKFDLALRGQL